MQIPSNCCAQNLLSSSCASVSFHVSFWVHISASYSHGWTTTPLGFSYSTARGISDLSIGTPGTGRLFKASETQEEDKESCKVERVKMLCWSAFSHLEDCQSFYHICPSTLLKSSTHAEKLQSREWSDLTGWSFVHLQAFHKKRLLINHVMSHSDLKSLTDLPQ